MIKTYNHADREYIALQYAASAFNILSTECTYTVEDCYEDYGAGLMWTTIIARRKDDRNDRWQCLSPREHTEVVSGDIARINRVISEWRVDKYNPDKSVRPAP